MSMGPLKQSKQSRLIRRLWWH